jgi:hypothetical protein
MKHNIIGKILLISSFALVIGSCDNSEDPDSVITSFEKFPVATKHTTVVTPEGDEEVIIFKFAFNDAQINDVVVEVGVGAASSATEDVDFTLSSHEIEVPAFAGQDSVSVEVHILQDGEVEAEDETIYLTFSSQSPSGLVTSEIQVATIKDSGVLAPLEVTLSWDAEFEFDGETYNLCDFTDLDFYLYNSDGDDVTGFAGATANCPESWELLPEDLEDGTYEIWVNFWNRYPFEEEICEDILGNDYACLGPFDIPLNITYTRGTAEKTIAYPVMTSTASNVWRQVNEVNTNPYVEFYVGSIELSDGVFTFLDIDGGNAGSLRKATSRSAEAKQVKASRTWPSL